MVPITKTSGVHLQIQPPHKNNNHIEYVYPLNLMAATQLNEFTMVKRYSL